MTPWIKSVVHNCIVHPLLPFLPVGYGDALHERNAVWAFGEPERTSHRDVVQQAQSEGLDITIHDLMNLAASDTPGAELFRVVCDEWSLDDPERAGPNGPRIGTVYIEDVDGHMEIRLVTRLRVPQDRGPKLKVVAA